MLEIYLILMNIEQSSKKYKTYIYIKKSLGCNINIAN